MGLGRARGVGGGGGGGDGRRKKGELFHLSPGFPWNARSCKIPRTLLSPLLPPCYIPILTTSTMKSVAVAAFLALAATADGFVVSPASTCAARTSSAATSQPTSFMSRRVAGAPVASSGAIKMSDSMNDAQQPTLEQVSELADGSSVCTRSRC